MRWLIRALLLLLPALSVQGLSSSGNRLLVINEESSEQDKYSQLWADLKSRDFQITYESPKNDKLALIKHGERAYDHVLLLPPKSKGLGPALTSEILLDFLAKEGNILLGLSGEASTPTSVNALLLEFDITLPPDKTSETIDHFNYDTISAGDKHDVLVLPRPSAQTPGARDFFGGDGVVAMPHAVAQTLGPSPLLLSILKAQATSYSYSAKDEAPYSEDPYAVGEQISLVSALQARNSARFTVFGAVEALQDTWFDASVKMPTGEKTQTSNRDFARQVTSWSFKETGVLKLGRVTHHLSSDSDAALNSSFPHLGSPEMYCVQDDLVYNIEVSEHTSSGYGPLQIPAEDQFQLEFTMLSPFHRLNLEPKTTTANSTIFATSFKVPDQHGIFAFNIDYKRPFLTNLEHKDQVTIRHFAHDEFPRSWTISGGWVWIGGIWVTIAGWVSFVLVWLFSAAPVSRDLDKKRM